MIQILITKNQFKEIKSILSFYHLNVTYVIYFCSHPCQSSVTFVNEMFWQHQHRSRIMWGKWKQSFPFRVPHAITISSAIHNGIVSSVARAWWLRIKTTLTHCSISIPNNVRMLSAHEQGMCAFVLSLPKEIEWECVLCTLLMCVSPLESNVTSTRDNVDNIIL